MTANIYGDRLDTQGRPADAYLPDGTPAGGPVTTAQTLAFELAEWGPDAGHLGGMWRAAAARDGQRYAEAIRGARQLRAYAATRAPVAYASHAPVGGGAWADERRTGLPQWPTVDR